ncbi:acid phosphatase [Clavibacter michiganensis]|uniref:acid phosphatase n=1 Tax=Clavibacter michiganensis TaxID=28447 RepID=UPI00292F626A|nr:phosphatase PAP2 family protein [Clavibacter michiganensis]
MRGSPGGGRAATAPPYGAGGRSADDPTEGTIITVITTVRPRARVAALLSATAILAVVLAGPGASSAQAATSPAPFDQATIDHVYASDATYDFVPMLDAFPTLKSGRPDIMQLNDDMTVQINQTAPKAQSDRAIIDQYADMSVSMSDGLGARLGAIYKAARDAGQLPKTAALLNKENGLVGRGGSTGPAKNHYANPRPYVRFPERLQYRDKPGGNAWAGQDGSYPSGHTSQAFWQGVSLATMLPELAPQILARASDAGNNRIVMGAHYPIDVMAGHMMGQKIVQRRWADPEFRDLYAQAATELRQVLEAGCGATLAVCIAADTPYLPTDQALAVYRQRLTYGFPLVGAAGQPMTVPDGAESLLRTSHPDLTDAQRRQVLALTAIDSGEPLDLGAAGSWERIDLAAAMTAKVAVAADGTVSLAGATTVDPSPAPASSSAPADPGATTAGSAGAAAHPATRGTAHAATLARTGSDLAPGAVTAALGLLVAGGGLVLVRRRRGARGARR